MFPRFLSIFRTFSKTKSTIDTQQMKNFDEFSKVWWDTKGVLRRLHEMNDLRIPWVQKRLADVGAIKKSPAEEDKILKGLSILDVGCGGGIVTEPLTHMGCAVTGLDPNIKLITIAQSRADKFNLPNIKYYCTTIEDHVIDNSEKYDVIVCFETIEHVKEQELFTKNCVKCLKPSGSIFFTTNSKSWPSKFITIMFLEDILKYTPKGTHEYEMFIDIEDLKRLLERENCKIEYTAGMAYNPFREKWFLTKNHWITNYMVHAMKKS